MLESSLKTADLFDCKVPYLKSFFAGYEYPWQMVPHIKDFILSIIETGLDGYELIGENILIGENVSVSPKAEICGPAIIGKNTEVRVGAYIRGSVITGENCVIGNSCEVKNSILLDGVQIPHYNYVGDSVLGNKSHLGAGSVCSNLKNDNKNVFIHGKTEHPTEMRKLGAILADYANVGCGCVLNPGTVIGKYSSVYPLVSVRGVVPPNRIVKDSNTIVERV